MRKAFTLLFALLTAANALPILAYSFSAVNDYGVTIYYNVLSNNPKTCEVTYKDADYNSYSGNVVIPESVTYQYSTYSVVSIRYRAFSDCTNLKSVSIPNTITAIGDEAFRNCSELTSINLHF